jgi:hypothetical protein
VAEEKSKLVVQAALLTEAHRKTYKAVDRYLDDWVRGGRFKVLTIGWGEVLVPFGKEQGEWHLDDSGRGGGSASRY